MSPSCFVVLILSAWSGCADVCSRHLERPLQLVALSDVEHSASLLHEVLRDGRVLVDREGKWSGMQARRAGIAKAADAEGLRLADEARQAIEHFAALAQAPDS